MFPFLAAVWTWHCLNGWGSSDSKPPEPKPEKPKTVTYLWKRQGSEWIVWLKGHPSIFATARSKGDAITLFKIKYNRAMRELGSPLRLGVY